MGGVPRIDACSACACSGNRRLFAALASPCTAGPPPIAGAEPKPLVENLPTSAAAQDFVRARCNDSCHRREEASRICYDLAAAPIRHVHQRQLQQGRHRRRHRHGLDSRSSRPSSRNWAITQSTSWTSASRWSTKPSAGPRSRWQSSAALTPWETTRWTPRIRIWMTRWTGSEVCKKKIPEVLG